MSAFCHSLSCVYFSFHIDINFHADTPIDLIGSLRINVGCGYVCAFLWTDMCDVRGYMDWNTDWWNHQSHTWKYIYWSLPKDSLNWDRWCQIVHLFVFDEPQNNADIRIATKFKTIELSNILLERINETKMRIAFLSCDFQMIEFLWWLWNLKLNKELIISSSSVHVYCVLGLKFCCKAMYTHLDHSNHSEIKETQKHNKTPNTTTSTPCSCPAYFAFQRVNAICMHILSTLMRPNEF